MNNQSDSHKTLSALSGYQYLHIKWSAPEDWSTKIDR